MFDSEGNKSYPANWTGQVRNQLFINENQWRSQPNRRGGNMRAPKTRAYKRVHTPLGKF